MEHRPVEPYRSEIEAALSGISLGGLRVFSSIGSTNDEAIAWSSQGAPDFSLVVADEQTAGRGRGARKWLTPPGKGLALSIVLRGDSSRQLSGRMAGLAAMAVADACEAHGLHPEIKWPNDVLLGGRKVAGILAESSWEGDTLQASILGIGVNVLAGSAPPADRVRYPATSIEHELGRRPDRWHTLHTIVMAVADWRRKLPTDEFLPAWENRLAFRGSRVTLSRDGQPAFSGTLLGLEDDGSLRLLGTEGLVRVRVGEIHLQPADDKIG